MLEVEDPDWVALEQYEDLNYEVLIEGTNEGPSPDSFENSTPEYYQVVYKTPWRTLISQTKREPTAGEIHSALGLVTHSPEFVFINAKMHVLQGLFLRLASMSKKKGFCIVCGRTGAGSSAAHDGDCVLYKALVMIQR